MNKKVLITDPISQSGIDLFKKNDFEIINRINDKENLDDVIKDIHVWIIRSGTVITKEHIKSATNLQIIGRAGVGVDNIDIKAATKFGVVVMNVPDGNSISAAEHTIALILALSRNVHIGHSTLLKGQWKRANLVGNELRNKTLGVIGLGRIGREVIDRALSFNMKIIGYDPYVNQDLFDIDKVKIDTLENLIKTSDLITVHVPLNDATKDLIDSKALLNMKRDAKIVNVARGGIINEKDLADALNEDIISGAGIDVFSKEPVSKDNPLLNTKNILLTPHLGASTYEAKEGVSVSICQQAIDFVNDSKLTNAINVPIGDMSILKKIQPFLDMCERLGKINSQLIDESVVKIEINCFGITEDVKPMSIAFIKGLLSNVIDNRVNYINALSIAEERGIEILNTFNPQSEKYANFVDTKIYTKDKIFNIGGGVFFKNEFRILRFMEHDINFIPKGNTILLKNKDVPGVVGKVGTILGKSGINIAEYILSRPQKNETPISVIKVDDILDDNCIDDLNNLDEIIEVKQFNI